MNLDRYRQDIERLVNTGHLLNLAMRIEQNPELKKRLNLDGKGVKTIPNFHEEYQSWYSEALACVTQLLPGRVDDFVSFYKSERVRKELTSENYTVTDYLKGLSVTRTRGLQTDPIAGPSAAISPMKQQVQIVEALQRRFDSSLFDIRTLVQADLFDDELGAAGELNKKGFTRAAGAVAGVVLEEHLETVCTQHKIGHSKKPTIGELNDLLKKKDTIDTPTWRFIQRLADLRNLCDHKKSDEPATDDIEELIAGVRKTIKTVF